MLVHASISLHAAGTFSNTEGLSSHDECTPCELGASCLAGSTEPTWCSPGTYADQRGQKSCTACPAGKFQDSTHATACKVCTANYYCTEGAAAALPCPSGMHANQTVLNGTGYLSSKDDCIPCAAGASCPVGSAEPTLCLPGSYAASSQMETCTLCPASEYQDRSGATACKPCTAGFYCEVGTAKPTPCPGGTFSSALGATSRSACQPVKLGFWAPLGSSAPETCPSVGFYCPGAAADTVNVPGGSKPIIVPVGSSTTTEEVEAVQKDFWLRMSCEAFDLDTVKGTLAALYDVEVALISLTNPCARRRLRAATRALAAELPLTITIASSATTVDGTAVTAPPIANLLKAIEAVDDSVICSSLGTAVGTWHGGHGQLKPAQESHH